MFVIIITVDTMQKKKEVYFTPFDIFNPYKEKFRSLTETQINISNFLLFHRPNDILLSITKNGACKANGADNIQTLFN